MILRVSPELKPNKMAAIPPVVGKRNQKIWGPQNILCECKSSLPFVSVNSSNPGNMTFGQSYSEA